MTRINSAIAPANLLDQHLLAEYRELPRVSALAAKWHARPPAKRSPIPAKFSLGQGHVLFFLDKGGFLRKRFYSIVAELQCRGFALNFTTYRDHPPGMNFDHVPTRGEFILLTERISQRQPKNPRLTSYQL